MDISAWRWKWTGSTTVPRSFHLQSTSKGCIAFLKTAWKNSSESAGTVIKHADEVAQAAGEAVEFPDGQRVAVLQRLETASRAGRLMSAPVRSSLKIFWHPAFFSAFNCMSAFWSMVEMRA